MPASDAVRTDCLVVGGGLVGATLAAALGSAGLRVTLLDRIEPDVLKSGDRDGRTTAIAWGSKVALEGVGVWPLIGGSAEPILDIRVSDGNAPVFLHFDHTDLPATDSNAGAATPLGYIVENSIIRDALFRRLQALDTVTFLAPAEVAGSETGPGAAHLTLTDGRRLAANLLVAADGAGSPLRHAAGIRVTSWTYDQISIVCTMTHDRPHRGIAHERFLPGGPFAALPMADGPAGAHRSSVVWSEKAALAPDFLALDDTAFASALGERFGSWYGDIGVEGPRWSYPLRLQHAETYIGNRLALVGDAAHVIHPIAGQGWNMGLRDVAALAEVVVDARRLGLDIGSEDVLARYQRWRRFDNVLLSGVTDSLNRLFSNDIAPVRGLRDVGMGAVNAVPPLRRFFMRHAMGMVGKLPRLVRGEML